MFSFFKRQQEEDKYKKPYYSFRSVNAGRVIDLAQEGQSQGTLILWDGYGGENQQFTIKQKGDEFYLKCRQTKQYLTVEGDHNGARIYGSPKTRAPNQQFRIVEKEEGSQEYMIYTFCGKVLDCAEEGTSNGTQIIQWDETGNNNQLWNFCDPSNITSSSSEID